MRGITGLLAHRRTLTAAVRSFARCHITGPVAARARGAGRAGDRGAATTLVTMLLGGGVLMGTTAVVVDIGQLYQEREELQSGADAAVMAVARVCAKTGNSVECADEAAQRTRALTYSNRNAKDGHSLVTVVCGSAGTGLPACPLPSNGALARCIDIGGGPPSGPYVEVRTATETASGSTLLPPTFARGLVGEESYNGKAVAACARAAWGTPSSLNGAAVTISYCSWNEITANGTRLGPQPPAIPTDTAVEGVLRMHGDTGTPTCPTTNPASGWNAPGGFGWLDENGTDPCRTQLSTHGTAPGDTGVGASPNCDMVLTDAITTHHPLIMWMPVFNGVRGTGSGTEYSINGSSAFVVTGAWVPHVRVRSWLTNRQYCSGSDFCIYGYFTTGLTPTSGGLTDSVPNYGVTTVNLAG